MTNRPINEIVNVHQEVNSAVLDPETLGLNKAYYSLRVNFAFKQKEDVDQSSLEQNIASLINELASDVCEFKDIQTLDTVPLNTPTLPAHPDIKIRRERFGSGELIKLDDDYNGKDAWIQADVCDASLRLAERTSDVKENHYMLDIKVDFSNHENPGQPIIDVLNAPVYERAVEAVGRFLERSADKSVYTSADFAGENFGNNILVLKTSDGSDNVTYIKGNQFRLAIEEIGFNTQHYLGKIEGKKEQGEALYFQRFGLNFQKPSDSPVDVIYIKAPGHDNSWTCIEDREKFGEAFAEADKVIANPLQTLANFSYENRNLLQQKKILATNQDELKKISAQYAAVMLGKSYADNREQNGKTIGGE